MKENDYETFYNATLDKYSAFKHEEGVHIDIYPGKIGKYSIENIKRVLDREGIRVVSPEDLIGIKLYTFLTAEMGKNKHLVDIYSILIGRFELDLNYLLKKVIPYVSKITEVSEEEIIEIICKGNEGVLKQFTPKERRFIKEECDIILNAFKHMKGYNPNTNYSSLVRV
jgi:Fe-S cluster biosynthesis and repair protein YggX